MTILNVWVARDSVTVAVDTSTVSDDGTYIGESSKLIPLVHANALIASRGHMQFLTVIFEGAHWQPHDLDSLVDGMPMLFPQCLSQIKNLSEQKGLPSKVSFDRQCIVLAGWSSKLDRPAAWYYLQEDAQTELQVSEITSYIISPGTDDIPRRLHVPADSAGILALATEQRRKLNELQPGSARGGLVVAQITRNQMKIQRLALDATG